MSAGPLDGKWVGTAESPAGIVEAAAELRSEDGTIKGSLTAGPYALTITGGSVRDRAVVLSFTVENMEGRMTATLENGVMRGRWEAGDASGTLTLKRPGAAAAAGAVEGAEPDAATIAGTWDGSATLDGRVIAFSLSVKIEGGKVTGTVATGEGSIPVEGTLKGGTLSLSLRWPDGTTIELTGRAEDGRLSGTFVAGGQPGGSWSAARRK